MGRVCLSRCMGQVCHSKLMGDCVTAHTKFVIEYRACLSPPAHEASLSLTIDVFVTPSVWSEFVTLSAYSDFVNLSVLEFVTRMGRVCYSKCMGEVCHFKCMKRFFFSFS